MKSNHKIAAHERAVRNTATQLRNHGCKVQLMPRYRCHFDLLVNGKLEVEVKVATKAQNVAKVFAWRFNLHRHGKAPDRVDFYVLNIPPLREFGFQSNLPLIVPFAEITKKTLTISPRSLMTTYGKYHARWDLIANSRISQTSCGSLDNPKPTPDET